MSGAYLGPSSDLNTRRDGRPLILVGTHHKTGTVWMRRLFEGFCAVLGERLHSGRQQDLPRSAHVFLQNHSRFDVAALGRSYRGLHVIRDPRDVLISAARYHARASESWLHVRRLRFWGLTYQEVIRRKRSLHEAILFEMDHAGRNAICEMLVWDRTRAEFCTAKYEDLIEDQSPPLEEAASIRRPESKCDYLRAVVARRRGSAGEA